MINYQQIKNKTYRYYKKIRTVKCPYLKTEVKFNSQGFWHLIYTGRNVKRPEKTQILRFQLLTKAVNLLSITTTMQEFEYRKSTKTAYFGFIAILNNWKIKTIVKKKDKGTYIFYSVIPNWVTNIKRDKRLCKGDMEKD